MSSSPSPIEAGRRERKRTQTLDHLAATAFSLFEQHGYDAVTMEQIAAQADVSKGTLYNHFPVKEALLAHQFHAELAAGGAQLRAQIDAQPDFASRLAVLLSASADWCTVRRPIWPRISATALPAPTWPPATVTQTSAAGSKRCSWHSSTQRSAQGNSTRGSMRSTSRRYSSICTWAR